MKNNALNFLRAAFPFLITIALWRLAVRWWNPAGVLALIPIFYATFVRPVPWFAPFALIFCFLLDYSFDTMFIWTVLWCIMYAANGFQTAIDITRMDMRGLMIFIIFMAVGMIATTAGAFHIIPILGAIWTYAWTCALYVPITALMERIGDD